MGEESTSWRRGVGHKRLSLVLSVGAAGAVAGAVNALHVLAQGGLEWHQWHLVPAGFAHGGLLAAIAACVAFLARNRPLWIRLVGVPVSGWLSGYLAGVPLWASILAGCDVCRGPFSMDSLLWDPFFDRMGLVASIAYAGWALPGRQRSPRLVAYLAIGVTAGVLGSAQFWIAAVERQAWRFFPPHGATWGVLVGLAAWRVARRLAPGSSSAVRAVLPS